MRREIHPKSRKLTIKFINGSEIETTSAGNNPATIHNEFALISDNGITRLDHPAWSKDSNANKISKNKKAQSAVFLSLSSLD